MATPLESQPGLMILVLDDRVPRLEAVRQALEERAARVVANVDTERAALDPDERPDLVLVTPALLVRQHRALSELVARFPTVPVLVLPPPAWDASAGLMDRLKAFVDGALAVARAARTISAETALPAHPPGHDADDEQMRELVLSGTRAMLGAMERRTMLQVGEGDRVADIAVALAEQLGGFELEQVRTAAELHDLGRLGVSADVWRKAGPLTDRERQDMQRHTMIGLQMLRPLLHDPQVLAGVLWHHERWDGNGYPDRLRGQEIPPLARVIAVADTLEALVTPRPHRPALNWRDALAEVVRGRGTQFAPEVIDALLAIETRLQEILESDDSAESRPAVTAQE